MSKKLTPPLQLWVPILALLCLFPLHAENGLDRGFDEQLQRLDATVAKVPFLQPQLDFAVWLAQGKAAAQVSKSKVIAWQSELEKLVPTSICQRIRQRNLQLHLNLMKTRTGLFEQLPADSHYKGSFAILPQGKQWYRHWLNSWLMLTADGIVSDNDIVRLKQIAKEELANVHPHYLQGQVDADKQDKAVFFKSQQSEIEDALWKRQSKVNQQLDKVLGLLPEIPGLNIKESSLPASFPAPGSYEPGNQTFYYHFTDQQLLAESLDWLYLHEAIPGHHLQGHIARTNPTCPSSGSNAAPIVTVEGWAAYVETLGNQLGLYRDPASLNYALEWRILRALRVLMDIGLHDESWSDQQALALWQQYLPMRMDIARRELARIKRWPAQAITYVYGKYRIEQAFENLQILFPKLEKRTLRKQILKLTNHPPHALELLPAIINAKEIEYVVPDA